MINLCRPGSWKRARRSFVAVVVCFGVLFSTLVDASSHASHAGHGHAPHTIAVVASAAQMMDACEQSAPACVSESDRRDGGDQHGALDPAHCCLVFVWMPIPELVTPPVRRLSLVRQHDALRATVRQDFERPPKILL